METTQLINNLCRRGFNAMAFESASLAVSFICQMIPPGASIGFGGSRTVSQIGLPAALNCEGRSVLHSSIVNEYPVVRDSAFSSDYYVSSANAITEDGDIVNIDGTCNRVAGIIYGCKNTIIIAGVNKVTADITAAIHRIRNVAAPPNAVRLSRKTPCAVTGKCSYCDAPDCMCNSTVIMHHPSNGHNVTVLIINETLGF